MDVTQPRIDLHLGDCIAGMAEKVANCAVHLVVTSIPFGALFAYSAKTEDAGNCKDAGSDGMLGSQFGLQMRFWWEQVARVIAPGCIIAMHIQQLSATKVQHGYQGLRDFRGAVIDMALRHGLRPHGEVAIPKNPQRIAQVRKLNSLLFVQGRRDSRALAPANNDYVLFFRAPGEGVPVRGLAGEDNPGGQFTTEEWIRWARGVWEDGWRDEDEMLEQLKGYREARDTYLAQEWRDSSVWSDILEIDVLDGWRSARGSDEEKHVCPLQLEVIRRCILLYSNEGDTVVDSFVGIGSTPYVCVELRRNCVAWELKESYHRAAVNNVARARERFAGKDRRGQRILALPPPRGAAGTVT